MTNIEQPPSWVARDSGETQVLVMGRFSVLDWEKSEHEEWGGRRG